jgi:hypothetical protein
MCLLTMCLYVKLQTHLTVYGNVGISGDARLLVLYEKHLRGALTSTGKPLKQYYDTLIRTYKRKRREAARFKSLKIFVC